MSLEGKVALITGGARGLGRAYVLHLARLGAGIVIADIDLQAAREYGEELMAETVEAEVVNLGRRAVGIAVDVTDRRAVDALVAESLAAFGRIDILVNNAGGNLRSHEEQAASLGWGRPLPLHNGHQPHRDHPLLSSGQCGHERGPVRQNRQRGLASGLVERARWRRDALQGGQGRHRPLHAGARR